MDLAEVVGELLGTAGRRDPYPLYERLRAFGPVVPVDGSLLLVTGYQEADEVLRDPGFGVADARLRAELEPDFLDHPGKHLLAPSVLQRNAPDHGRMRAPIASVFTPRRVAALAPAVTAAVEDLLDRLDASAAADPGRPVDLLEAFAFRLPIGVICELLGVPAADRHLFRPLAADLTVTLETMYGDSELAAADRAAVRLAEYFDRLTAERRADPRDDLVSALVAVADADPGRLSPRELVANLALLLIAGFETTGNLIGNALVRLLAEPATAEALRTGALDPAPFTEEVLRHDSPVQLTSRVALADGRTVAGRPVDRHTDVLLLLGAANRDPRRFADPGRFDPARFAPGPAAPGTGADPGTGRPAPARALSFGSGPHYCLGAQLARLEAVTALPALLRRFPGLAQAGPVAPGGRLVLRGPRRLPVTLAAGR
ncbi:cytochrome P450 [Kitasatospora sp. NPDC088391]|uniref:cytochrome P450 n=1 Tax=Kitasatospora sp. NPDC088391 TaxID=3364074 RepID=UPI00380482A6